MNIKFDYRKYYLLDIFLYILPFTIILGNSTLNSTRFLILVSFIFNFFKHELHIKYKIKLRYIYLISIFIVINVFFSENYIKSLIASVSLIGYLVLFLSILFMLDDCASFKRNFTLNSKTFLKNVNTKKIYNGHTNEVLGNPINVLLWLFKELKKKNIHLNKNVIVATGTTTPIVPVKKGDKFLGHIKSLGNVRVNF